MTPNPRHWARELWQRSRDRGLQTHIDVLVDATGLDDYPLLAEHARQSDPPALFKLLEQTPEAALADEGPLLLRLLGALDFHDTLGGQRPPTPLEHQRGKLDSCCEGDLYSHLLAKD